MTRPRGSRAAQRRVLLGLKRLSIDMASLPAIERETIAGVLAAEAEKPMRGGSRDLPHDGIFGDSHLQKELF